MRFIATVALAPILLQAMASVAAGDLGKERLARFKDSACRARPIDRETFEYTHGLYALSASETINPKAPLDLEACKQAMRALVIYRLGKAARSARNLSGLDEAAIERAQANVAIDPEGDSVDRFRLMVWNLPTQEWSIRFVDRDGFVSSCRLVPVRGQDSLLAPLDRGDEIEIMLFNYSSNISELPARFLEQNDQDYRFSCDLS